MDGAFYYTQLYGIQSSQTYPYLQYNSASLLVSRRNNVDCYSISDGRQLSVEAHVIFLDSVDISNVR